MDNGFESNASVMFGLTAGDSSVVVAPRVADDVDAQPGAAALVPLQASVTQVVAQAATENEAVLTKYHAKGIYVQFTSK